jgi:Zn-dependent protease
LESPSTINVFETGNRLFPGPAPKSEPRDRYWLHALLFVLTLASTMVAGGNLVGRAALYEFWDPARPWTFFLDPNLMLDGLRFGGSLLLFLTVHEFGHYFAARFHGIRTSLPYYIPTLSLGLGTLGAVIRIREPIPNTRKLFDVGVAGPLAGFVIALAVLIYALVTLPDPSYIMDLEGHEELKAYIEQYGQFPNRSMDLTPPGENVVTILVGQTPLYWLLTQFFADVPPMDEMYHYPMLFAGWMGLFFTALNLLPVGQLDGGHILYALVGPKWHSRVAQGFVVLLLISGSIGFVRDVFPALYAYNDIAGQMGWFLLAGVLYFYLSRVFKRNHKMIAPCLLGIVLVTVLAQYEPDLLGEFGYWGWFIWCMLIVFLIKVDHPPVLQPEPLTAGRKIQGILSIVIFILCFSFAPLRVV